MSNKNHISDMEKKLAQLKANHVDTPAQSKARKLVKPLFMTLGFTFLGLFIMLIFVPSSKNQTIVSTQSIAEAIPREVATASSPDLKVLNTFVTSITTTLNKKEAHTLSLTDDSKENNCTIVFTLDYLIAGVGELSNVKRNQPDFDFSCSWTDKYYVLSSNHDTYAKVQIIEAAEGMPMKVGFNAKLTTQKGEQATFIAEDVEIKRFW
ncbi:hypothetical protein [Shewanella sp. 10N.286.54.B9]|uniref:hypothetical protein n=1 Tax=Shewanella sp. 10N.286.54.B9 TaxID=3229719 RepID=UPI00354CF480